MRDEILNIMHRNKIKEVKGTWMEEWHQKLHNVSAFAEGRRVWWQEESGVSVERRAMDRLVGLGMQGTAASSHKACPGLAHPSFYPYNNFPTHLPPPHPIHFLSPRPSLIHAQNTTPDDIHICEAYLAFLRSNGNNSEYWRVLTGAR